MNRAYWRGLSPKSLVWQGSLCSFQKRWMTATSRTEKIRSPCGQVASVLSKGQMLPKSIIDFSTGQRNFSNQTMQRESSFLTDIYACKTSESILDQTLVHKGQRAWDQEELSQCLTHLMTTHYENLAHIPWLQTNHHIAFIQLLLADELERCTAACWSHTAADLLINGLETHCCAMTPGELVNCFLAVQYLGAVKSDKADTMLKKLLFECQERIHTFDLSSLSVMSGMVSRMFPRNWTTMRLILLRAKEVVGEPGVQWTPENVFQLAQLVNNTGTLDVSEFPVNMFRKVLDCITQDGYLENPDHISYYMKLGRKFFLQNTKTDQYKARQMISLLSEASLKHMDKFEAQHIAECCSSLHQSRCFEDKLVDAFTEHALKLLSPRSKLSDVSNLFYSLNRRTPTPTKRVFENEIYNRLDDADIVILSNLAENFLSVNIQNDDLLIKYQALVAEKAEKLTEYMTRFNKVTRLLIRKPFRKAEHEQKFTDAILKAMDNQFRVSGLALFWLYLFPATHTVLDQSLVERLLNIIPKMGAIDHHRLAQGINQMRHPVPAQLHKQIATIQSSLHEWIMKKSNDVTSLDYLFQLTLEVIINNRKRDPTLTEHFLGMYPKMTKKLTDISMMKVIYVFLELQYYLPEVYDNLIDYAIQHQREIQPEKLAYLLAAVSRVAYVPKRFDEFMEIMLGAFHKLGKAGSIQNQLLMMRNFNVLGAYPERELCQIFSLDFIERLDAFMEENPQQRSKVERTMMTLNRNVVLECPQLDVPWFHEQQCADSTATRESERQSLSFRFKNDVESVLLDPELLGNQKNLRRWVFSPYGYVINFECILDENQKPVEVNKYAGHPVPINWQRACYLALMIPYCEWYSMGLCELQAKVDYLHSKIFTT